MSALNQSLKLMLQRLTEKLARANSIQHSGGKVVAEDWAELYQLENEARAILETASQPTTQPRVLILVSGGVADYVCDDGIDVEIFDRDNYDADPEETGGVPRHYADLATPIDVPVNEGEEEAGLPVILTPVANQASSVVAVGYWNSQAYNPNGEPSNEKSFLIEIADQRESSGQLYIDVASVEGNVDDMMCATIEINRLPGSKDDVQCLHLHFDGSNLAASFFKQGDKFIIRPETNVSIRDTVLPNGEHGWILE